MNSPLTKETIEKIIANNRRGIAAHQIFMNAAKLTQENEQLRRDLDAARAACAEMRQAMVEVLCDPDEKACFIGSNEDRAIIDHALSRDCGKDYVHKDKVRPLVDELKETLYIYRTGGTKEQVECRLTSALDRAQEAGL